MININNYSIGATAAIITSLALIAGLAQGDSTRTSVIAGILIIAVADNVPIRWACIFLGRRKALARKRFMSQPWAIS